MRGQGIDRNIGVDVMSIEELLRSIEAMFIDGQESDDREQVDKHD